MTKEILNSNKKNISNNIKDIGILEEKIKEENLIIKYFLNTVIFLGSFGFLTVGISSYLKLNIIPFLDASEIIFFPQGITMSIYGTLGLLLSINQILILYLKIGEGYNKFDKQKGTMEIYRRGFPGKNSDINITYPLNDILRSPIKRKTKIKLSEIYEIQAYFFI